MYYLLKTSRFDYGVISLDPVNEDYWSYCAKASLAEGTRATMHITSPLTRKVRADLMEGNRAHLCSLKLRELLEENCAGIHFYDTEVFDKAGRLVEKPYFLLHIDKIIPCLDFQRSNYVASEKFDPSFPLYSELQFFNKFVLDKNIIGEADIFLISNSPFPATVIISESVALKITAERLDGVSVNPISEVTWKGRWSPQPALPPDQ